MNRNLKFAIAAAIASLGVTGQAHAFTQSAAGTSGSLFLYAFEDRQANQTATNTAVFELGSASSFDTTVNQSWDFSANSAWTTYISTIANPTNIHWGVFGAYGVNGAAGSAFWSTFAMVPASVNGTSTSGAISHANAMLNYYGLGNTSAGSGVISLLDGAAANWDDNAGAIGGGILTAGLGNSLDFYKYTQTGSKGSSIDSRIAFATGGDADYFTLDSTGHLSYVAAPVPEADSYAMMLAGLGLVGYMVRRRKAA